MIAGWMLGRNMYGKENSCGFGIFCSVTNPCSNIGAAIDSCDGTLQLYYVDSIAHQETLKQPFE